MDTGVVPGALGEVRAMSAAGGTTLTTTPVFIEAPDGAAYMFIDVMNFAGGAGEVRLTKCPYLAVIKTTDKLATKTLATDYSAIAQDARQTSLVDLSLLDTAANSNFLYVGAKQQFRGVSVVNNNANAVASVLTVKYWNGTAWTAVAGLTDGTASAGATQAQNGNVTWTIPSDWTSATLAAMEAAGLVPWAGMMEMFWTRWEVSVKLGATVKHKAMIGMNRSTAYIELLAAAGGVSEWADKISKSAGGYAGVEARTDAGTANVIINVATLPGAGFAYNT